MKRLLLLTKGLVLSTLRDPQVLFWNIAFPLFWAVIYRFLFGRFINSIDNGGMWMLAGLISLNLLAFGLIGSSTQMLELREKGVLRRMRASPLPAWQMFVAYLINNMLICFAQIAVIATAGALVLSARTTLAGALLALPMLLICVIGMTALGQLVSSLAPRAGVALAIGQILYFAQMFVTNLVMPLEALPESIRAIAVWLPGYLIGDLMRAPLMSATLSPTVLSSAVLMLIYTVVCGVLASRFFRWEPLR
jgi:ABC-2 type transport system permease protein